MAFNSSQRAAATTVLDLEPDFLRYATCPMCRTTDPSLTEHALTAGGDWRCVRCGQHWDAPRLAAVAAYEAWALEHDDSRLQARYAAATPGSTPPHANDAMQNGPRQHREAISTWDNEGGRLSR